MSTSSKMTAYRMVGWQRQPEFQEVVVPEPGPGEVRIKIGGAGACHSDLHLMEFAPGTLPFRFPFTLGHENAGWVDELGPGVDGIEPGEAVIVYGPWGCGHCRTCVQGAENYCENAGAVGTLGAGLGHDGGMAPYMIVPSPRYLVPLGDLDPRDAAPLTDAGLTSYHAVKRSLPLLGPGSTAVVIGAGGLGQMAVQILKAMSAATVVALDTSPMRLEEARKLGADEALLSDERAVDRILDVTRGLGAEVVIDLVGAEATLQAAALLGRTLGHITIVGLGAAGLPVSFFSPKRECAVASIYWGTIPELSEVIALARAGKIKTVVEVFPLDQAPEAYHRLHEGRIKGRAVMTPT